MLKLIRRIVAIASLVMVTLLFLDFTGTAQTYFGWMAKIQFLPALLALNAAVVIGLILLTIIFGRIYCSVICPLGIMQDGFARLGRLKNKNRYSYSRAKNALRYTMLAIMVAAIALGIGAVVALLAPYSSYGRIASSFLQPLWIWGNNLLAGWAEARDSYAFYHAEMPLKSLAVVITAAVTLLVLAILAWRNGRTYCNTVCPVGTLLGFFARFSLLRPAIDTSKCVDCRLCSRRCKAACIDIDTHAIDYSRCVTCFDCIGTCRRGAISYRLRNLKDPKDPKDLKAPKSTAPDTSRRSFIAIGAAMAATAVANAADKTVDGGLAAIEDKKIPNRRTRIVPAGARSLRNVERHCTACQLCVSACPNGVLRPSADIGHFMQPEASYEVGYCRPECTRCSEVCPAGAITPITRAEKSSIQVGHAVWVKQNCVVLTDGVECGNCARHCPVGAITMVETDSGAMIPAVNTERCIGCGACENLCPARPFSAIYVEGHQNHRII